MYTTVLALHSIFRWIVLIALLFAIYRAVRGWRGDKTFLPFDNKLRHWTATVVHIQLMLGLWLYFISPIVRHFLSDFKTTVHERELRFFGMEHITMMILAVIVITIGSAKAKRKVEDRDKFKVMAIWFAIGLFVILLNIPWKFSPLVSRPYFRTF